MSKFMKQDDSAKDNHRCQIPHAQKASGLEVLPEGLEKRPDKFSLLIAAHLERHIVDSAGRRPRRDNRQAAQIPQAGQDKKICQIDWQKNTLVASIERDGHTITPKGDTEILPGDLLMVLIGRQYYAADYAAYEKLING